MVQKGTFQNHRLALGMDKVRKTGNGKQKGNGICLLLELGSEADRNKVLELEHPYPLPNPMEDLGILLLGARELGPPLRFV